MSLQSAPSSQNESWLYRKATSNWQARLQSLYFGWLSFASNPLALTGLLIILVLLFVAAFAPLLATHDPIPQDLTRTCYHPVLSMAPTRWDATSTAGSSTGRGSRSTSSSSLP